MKVSILGSLDHKIHSISEKLCNKSLYLIVGQNPIAGIIFAKSELDLKAPE